MKAFVLLMLRPCLCVDNWAEVTDILQKTRLAENFAFSAGDAGGRKYTFERGSTKMSTKLLMASSSKFPVGVAIAGVVNEGHLSFDTFAHEVWPWWTKDPCDKRSRVTLRSLLSFTSGFYAWDPSGEVPCLVGPAAPFYEPEACAKEIYRLAPFKFEPGTTFSYNSFHLQVAGALAATAANTTVQDMLSYYLIRRTNMTDTQWLGGKNPFLAAGMVTTGYDYDKFLRSYMSYELVPKAIADQMEADYLGPPWMPKTKAQLASKSLVETIGHYSMCNYYECLSHPPWNSFPSGCKAANIHADPGLFGYYPLIDRANGMYMQIVFAAYTKKQPTAISISLRSRVKPYVDKALGVPVQVADLRNATLPEPSTLSTAILARNSSSGAIPDPLGDGKRLKEILAMSLRSIDKHTLTAKGLTDIAGLLNIDRAPVHAVSSSALLSQDNGTWKKVIMFDVLEDSCRNMVSNKNLGDTKGDAYFTLKNVYLAAVCSRCKSDPRRCLSDPALFDCLNPEATGKLVFRKLEVEVQGNFGKCQYCNVVHDCRYTCMGLVPSRCGKGPVGLEVVKPGAIMAPPPIPFVRRNYQYWNYNAAKTLQGGKWYSLAQEGEGVYWRNPSIIKTISADCQARYLTHVVQKRGEPCFNRCPQPENQTSLCWIECFFDVTLGQGANQSTRLSGGMTADEIADAWSRGFEPESVDGGCPPLSPNGLEELII